MVKPSSNNGELKLMSRDVRGCPQDHASVDPTFAATKLHFMQTCIELFAPNSHFAFNRKLRFAKGCCKHENPWFHRDETALHTWNLVEAKFAIFIFSTSLVRESYSY